MVPQRACWRKSDPKCSGSPLVTRKTQAEFFLTQEGPRRTQEAPGGARRVQEGPGRPRRAQVGPGGPRKAQEGPGRPRREDPGRRKEKQSCWLVTTHASSFKQRDKLATKQANKPADNTNNQKKNNLNHPKTNITTTTT